MAMGKKVQAMHDPNEIARVSLRGVQVGVDGAGRPRVCIDKDLSDEDITAIIEALPTVHRRMMRRLGRGRTALH